VGAGVGFVGAGLAAVGAGVGALALSSPANAVDANPVTNDIVSVILMKFRMFLSLVPAGTLSSNAG
jgi:hypothetical protein